MYAPPAPPRRPWWQKKRFTLPLGLFAALIVVVALAGTQNEDGATDTAGETSADTGEAAAADQTTTTQAADQTAEPTPGGGEEAEDFVACTNIDGESYTIEVVNQSPNTSSYFLTIVLLDESGARIGDTFDSVDALRPNERLIAERLALVDFAFAGCELLELDRFAAESDPGEMAEVACTIDGPDVFEDVAGTVTATNGTPEDSDYIITLALVDAGGVRRGSASAFIERVRPGESAPTELFSVTTFDPGLVCEVAGVERNAAG